MSPARRLLPQSVLLAFLTAAQATPAMGQDAAGPGNPGLEAELPPLAEGPLSSDALLPASAEAASGLAVGDQALVSAHSEPLADRARRLRGEAFEAWNNARITAGPHGSVRLPPAPGEEARTTIGIGEALWARLAGLDAPERRAWWERFDIPARDAFARMRAGLAPGSPGPRESTEAGAAIPPGTPSAVRASLLLGDLALESGHEASAVLHWQRGRRTLDWLRDSLEPGRQDADLFGLDAALAARDSARSPAVLDDLADRPHPQRLSPTWESATTIAPGTGLLLAEGGGGRPGASREDGTRPGLTILSTASTAGASIEIAVQARDAVHMFRVSPEGRLRRGTSFSPAELLTGFGVELDPRTTRRAPGWPLLPAARDGVLFLVEGRAVRSEEANALLAVRPGATAGLSVLGQGAPAHLRWAVIGNRRIDARGRVEDIPDLADLPSFEFQPGPVLVGDTLCVEVRVWGGEVHALALGFDPMSGALLWRQDLVRGSDLGVAGLGRTSARIPRASTPPSAVGGRLFLPTNLGAGVLIDALDGTPIYAFQNRRRSPDSLGWPGRRPLTFPGGILFAPFDSDFVYALEFPDPDRPLRLLPDAKPPFPLLAPPLPIGESRTLLGGDGGSILVQGRAGRERTVSELPRRGSNRRDAIYLGPDEHFTGRGIAGEERVVAATDRAVYLFDRTRELLLLGVAPLPRTGSRQPGGDLFDLGGPLLLLGPDALFTFLAR